MSEERGEEHSEERTAIDMEAPPAAAEPPPGRPGSRGAALGLLALLIVILAGVALSPFWAPQLGLLLPWGTGPATSGDEYAALAARVAAIEQRPSAPRVDVDALRSVTNALGQRVEQLETAVNGRIATSSTDIEAIKSQIKGLSQRVDQLEAASGGDRQLENSVAAAKSGMQNLEQRVAAVEAQSSSRKASDAADLQNLQQQLAHLGTTTTDLTNRVGGLEREQQSQNTAEPRTDAMLALLLVQMRQAVDQAQPFPAEYTVFTTLAHDAGLAAAAEPLADAALNGVASRAVLVKRLAELAVPVATASEPATEADLGQRVLARLRGLVTIRRTDGPSQTGPEAAVSAAQSVLSRGDLAGAVAALDGLSGANAEAAGPWLRMARERLAVEAALDHLQRLLTARLESASPGHPAPPPAAPHEPPEKARAPS